MIKNFVDWMLGTNEYLKIVVLTQSEADLTLLRDILYNDVKHFDHHAIPGMTTNDYVVVIKVKYSGYMTMMRKLQENGRNLKQMDSADLVNLMIEFKHEEGPIAR